MHTENMLALQITKTAQKKKFEWHNISAEKLHQQLEIKSADFWQKRGQLNALGLFHFASRHVPAYKHFLHRQKISPQKIRSLEDFKLVPPTDKINYIQQYSLSERSVGGTLAVSGIIASSSGTTGNPNYWPRGKYQEMEAVLTHELLFRQLFSIHKKKTLIIVGFPMGVYVSGIATIMPSWIVADKYGSSVVAAGNNKQEVLKAIKNLHEEFEQILLIGHPFFVKDVLETGAREGIAWAQLHMNFLFCSEGFSETWREYVLKEAGLAKTKAYNTYGSSELLLMAYETPISVNLRKNLEINKAAAKSLLGTTEVPNLFQYNPALRYIEVQDSELLFTSISGLPLVRFNLHDRGIILPYNKAQLQSKTALKGTWQLPFVGLFGRSDMAVVFYAANIYPQHIHRALSHKTFLKHLTGKFSMNIGYHKNMDEYLHIHIELKPDSKPTSKLSSSLQATMIATLKELNAEYLFLWHNLQKDLRPKISLHKYQDQNFFPAGLKPKYIL